MRGRKGICKLLISRGWRGQDKIRSNRLEFRVPVKRPPKCQTVDSSLGKQENETSTPLKWHPGNPDRRVFVWFCFVFVMFCFEIRMGLRNFMQEIVYATTFLI